MNSEVTLTNNSTSVASNGQIRLVYKRSDPRNATLLEHGVPRYFLATSHDGVSKVKISDTAGNAVVEVERRHFAKDIFKFANRYDGKAVKVINVLRKAPSTSNGQRSMALDTPDGLYYWRKAYTHHWMLYEESSSTSVAWTEYTSGSTSTWALIVDAQVETVLDYVLASLFYLVKFELHDGWENMDSRAAYLSIK